MRYSLLAPVAALALAACAPDTKATTDVVLVTPEPSGQGMPDVCKTRRDPKWTVLARRKAVSKSDMATNDAVNGRAFDTLAGKRAGCERELKARG